MNTLLRNNSHSSQVRGGFTLIELLVVIGLIAVLAAGIGVAMKDGNPSSALRAGQNTLVGLLSGARGQAALNQANAMIVVEATAGENCMRTLQIVVREGTAADTWRAVGAPITLPQGIYIVPPAGAGVAVMPTGAGWTDQRRSAGFQSTTPGAITPADSTFNPFAGRTFLRFQTFSPLGTTDGAGRLLITSGRPTGPAAVELDNSAMIRGITVSRYGVATFINEAETFDQL